ncbi:hypothetical protein DFQ27_009143 [Actinomortierella ambigua]|uniref:Nucleosome assembly protein n=1 Tax=Actinomortierella ambigua TaxID=1343610 RepID=A0A9P6QJQ3_9FUNG|nr:hypothetical protein DFQ27_009143 [Actinomortierella ambigua]
MESSSANVDIKKKQQQQAPTPQNTPIFSAPISSSVRPTVADIEEDMETIQTPGTRSSILANNPQLMSMLQGRLGNLVGAPSGYVQTLSPVVRRRVRALKALQKKHAVLEVEFQNEILALEKKYLALYTPLYEKRTDLVTGKAEATDAEVADGFSEDEDEEEEDDKEDDDEEKAFGIPEFWLTALKSHPQFVDIITEKDEEALKSLVDIRLSYFDQPGFRLEFEFTPNDFFTNTVLTKTYFYQDEAGYGGDFVYDHAEGSTIDWKEGMDLTVTVETKKQRHKNTNKTRVVKKTVPAETFFSFFNPPVAPSEEDEDELDEDDDIDERLEADYALGEELKDSIIPRAVDWFTGKALQYQDQGDVYDDDDLDDYEDEDDEDDDEDDEDDEDDDDDVPAKDEKAPECKQQ